MKSLFVVSALAAGLAATAPASAEAAGLSGGMSVKNGHVAGHLTLAAHDREFRRGHRRGRYCQSWRRAHRTLHRRFDHVRLQRRVYNRRGHKVFIVRARTHRGRPLRVRYNSCTRRITQVKRFGRHHGRDHRRYQGRNHDRRQWHR